MTTDITTTPTAQMDEQPEFLEIKDLDKDRDFLVDFMDANPERSIYRQVLKEWSTRYSFVKRGEKGKIVEYIIKEMKQKGVRFWVRDHSPAYFGVRVVIERNERKICERVQRCMRELNRKLYGSNESYRSETGTDSLAPSFSAASNGSTIRTKESISPPIRQVDVPHETVETNANTFPVPMEVLTKSFGTSSTSDSSASISSIHEVSVVSNTKNKPLQNPEQQQVVPAPPELDRAIFPPPPSYLAVQDTFFLPPNLERHTESWCSLLQHCYPDLQALMNDDEANAAAESDTASPAHATTPEDYSYTKRPREREVLADSDEESQEPPTQRQRVIVDDAPNPMSTVVNNTTPIWVHMSRHLMVLEQRLEFIEKDNMELRHRLAKYERNIMTVDETNNVLDDHDIVNYAQL